MKISAMFLSNMIDLFYSMELVLCKELMFSVGPTILRSVRRQESRDESSADLMTAG